MQQVSYNSPLENQNAVEIQETFDKQTTDLREVIIGLGDHFKKAISGDHYKKAISNFLIEQWLPSVLTDIIMSYSDLSEFPFDCTLLRPLFSVPGRDGLYTRYKSAEEAKKCVENLNNMGFVWRQDDNNQNNGQDDYRRPPRDLACLQFFSNRPLLNILRPLEEEHKPQHLRQG